MSTESSELCLGRKTFFIAPEVSLFPEEYMKSYFLKGFESYFIDDDPYCSLETKIQTLLSLFQDIILFFNIDRPVHGIDWPVFIRRLHRTCGDGVIIGVMHRKNSPEETRSIERLYLYDIGITGGCVPVEYQKTKNLYNFLNVLCANQANGQRKSLRALCDKSFKMNLMYRGRQYNCVLRDISISHFSCVFPEDIPEIPLHEKISDMQMNLRGVHLKVDGVICLKRTIGNDVIHVFVFRTPDGREGLCPEHMLRINDLIHGYFFVNMGNLLKAEFEASRVREAKERRAPIAPDVLACARDKGEEITMEQLLALAADT